MKKIAVVIALTLLSFTGKSQTGKLPLTGMLNEMKKDTDLVRTGMTKVKAISFKIDRHGKPDTDYVFNMDYNPAGYLKQTAYYGYDSVLHIADPGIMKLAGILYDRLIDCSRITYEYDAHDNLTTKMSYNITPAGSYEAFFEGAGAVLVKREKGSKKEITDEDRKQVFDSIKKAGIPAIEKEGKLSRFRYDADDNMVYSIEGSDERHYTYIHDQAGRVKVMRHIWNRNGPGSPRDMSAAEIWLTYTTEGLPATITNYVGQDDTGNIAIDSRMTKKEEISYNKAGQKVRIQTSNSGKPYHKVEVIDYKGSVPVGDAVYEVNSTTGKNDTTTYTTFTWNKTLKTSTKRKYYDGKILRIEREEVYLDDMGLQTKSLEYAKPRSGPEKLLSMGLYFYSK